MKNETNAEVVKVEERKVHPPIASRGGDNAFYLKGCPIVQHQPSYAACLFKIEEIEAGRPENVINKECECAIRGNGCPALNMRQDEQLAGQALYYFPRQFIRNQVITNLTPASEIPKPTNFNKSRVKPALLSVPKKNDDVKDDEPVQEDGYAAAINAALKEAAEPVKPQPKPVPQKPAPKPQPASTPTAPKAPPAPRPAMMAGETPLQYARRISAATV